MLPVILHYPTQLRAMMAMLWYEPAKWTRRTYNDLLRRLTEQELG